MHIWDLKQEWLMNFNQISLDSFKNVLISNKKFLCSDCLPVLFGPKHACLYNSRGQGTENLRSECANWQLGSPSKAGDVDPQMIECRSGSASASMRIREVKTRPERKKVACMPYLTGKTIIKCRILVCFLVN